MKYEKTMKAIATTISVIGETGFGILLCPSFIEAVLVMGTAQAMVILYGLLGTSVKVRRVMRRIFGSGKSKEEDQSHE